MEITSPYLDAVLFPLLNLYRHLTQYQRSNQTSSQSLCILEYPRLRILLLPSRSALCMKTSRDFFSTLISDYQYCETPVFLRLPQKNFVHALYIQYRSWYLWVFFSFLYACQALCRESNCFDKKMIAIYICQVFLIDI